MNKSYIFGALFSLAALISCNQAVSQPKAAESKAAQTDFAGDKTKTLSSLTKEQQDAVRLLVRDTLISNPEILLEAQQAYEAKMARQQNESVAKNFDKYKNEAADLSFGPANAKVTFIEFFDYRCGFCHAANPWVMQTIANNKDVRFIFKEFPILSPNSVIASKAAYASKSQGKYLQFHQALMQAKGDLSLEQIMNIAQSVGLDTAKLKAEMDKPNITAYIEKVKAQAMELNMEGTPGFLINGKMISGFNQEELISTLEAAKSN